MKVHELSFYSQFQCTAEKCPNTCCHGWQIVLDNETVQKYMMHTGFTGFHLQKSLKRHSGSVSFKGSKGKCPFLAKNKLCNIQLSLGEDYLPDVCRIFPRQRVNYGPFAEELLFLACPEAVRLFLENLEHLHYKTVEREVSYAKSGTNDDTDYLQELLDIRSALNDRILNSNLPRTVLYSGLLSYAKTLQQSYISGYPLHNAAEPSRPNLDEHIAQEAVPFIIPHDVTYAMLNNGFYHIFLKFVSPFLYDLCRIYLKNFRHMNSVRGDLRMKELKDNLHRNIPMAESILRGYFVYYLMEDFLTAYEDYSFLRKIAVGIMHTHLLELFFALFYDEKQRLTEDNIVQIITVYIRRGRHNEIIEKDMYGKMKCLLLLYKDS